MYGSELTCMRFAPTGFPGCVGVEEDDDEDDPEHPASASVHKASKKKNAVLAQETSTLIAILPSLKALFE